MMSLLLDAARIDTIIIFVFPSNNRQPQKNQLERWSSAGVTNFSSKPLLFGRYALPTLSLTVNEP
jgi:hypothetical protein